MNRIHSLLALPLLAIAASGAANAAEDSAEFQVRIEILESCTISATAPTDIDFLSHTRSTNAPVTAQGTLTVNCSKGTPYEIGLDAGMNAESGARRMSNGAHYVPYELFKDTGYSKPWGNDAANMQSGFGTATDQALTVYGKVSSTNFPAGTYVDTVTARVVY